MHPQERDLLVNFLERFQRLPAQTPDTEADALIRQAIRRPDAAYLLIQQAIVQEIGLQRAEQRIRQLEQELQQARGAVSPQESGGFLGGLFGGGGRTTGGWTDTPPPPLPQSQSWGQAGAPPVRSGSGFGSFLASAAAAAAGVAGGALLFEGVRSFIDGGSESPSPPTAENPGDVASSEESSFFSGIFGGDAGSADGGGDGGSGWI